MSNERAVEENNRIMRELFAKHKVIERLEEAMSQVDRSSNDIPEELRAKIECLHEEMDNIRKHASNNCRRFSPRNLNSAWKFSGGMTESMPTKLC